MNLNLLLQHFDELIVSRSQVKELRQAILQLAVQGKLVPQDYKDEPAAELLQKIAAEKKKLIAAGKIKREKPLPPIRKEERPYELPEGWEWVRLGEIVDYGGTGKHFEAGSIPAGSWILDLKDIEKDTSQIVQRFTSTERNSQSTKIPFCKDDVLYGRLRPYLNKIVVADSDGFCTTEIVPLHAYQSVSSRYLMYAMKSPYFQSYVNARTYGTKMPRLGTMDGQNALIALPPLAEQHRIVAKVDALMQLCDALEQKLQEQESVQPDLALAVFHEMEKAVGRQALSHAWERVSDHFGLLLATPQNVKKLGQTILELAVRGKLVPQDPQDEPASVLLQKIVEKKKKFIAAGKIKRKKPLPPIQEEDRPYELPKGWVWVRLGEIGFVNPKQNVDDEAEVSFVPMKLIPICWGQQCTSKITVWREVKTGSTHFAEGDVVLAKITPCFENGKSAVMRGLKNGIGAGTTELHVFHPYQELVLSEYVLVYLKTARFLQEGALKMTGSVGQQRVPKSYFAENPFPLPPLAEQHRIVAQVDTLMQLCDELEAQLRQAREHNQTLVQAIL